ncbi:MAG: bacteriohemerythrin [Spirochaetaceae bacterium]|jgi:hemerythrin-like metal-binding protein|nr:bacteriohemerythrin [Spirochaetaceae bacterium]
MESKHAISEPPQAFPAEGRVPGYQTPRRMPRFKKFLQKYIYSDALPLEARITNAVYLTGFVSSFILMLFYSFLESSKILTLVILGISASVAALFFLNNHFSLYRICRWITIIVLCFIFFPAAFFPLGGLYSPMPAYFVLSIVLIFLFSYGKIRILLLILHIAEAVFCYYLTTRPSFAASFIRPVSQYNRYLDAIAAFIVVGLCIGFIVDYQRQLNKNEREKLDSARSNLVYRGKLLQMVNHIAQLLLYAESENPEENFKPAMETMARCIDADRMYIWQNRMVNGKLHYVQEFEWVKQRTADPPKAKDGYAYDNSIPLWEEKLLKKEVVNGPLGSLSPEEQRVLSPFGIKSILVIPVFLEERFWGFVSFDNCHKEQACSDETVDMLRSGCLLIANAAAREKNRTMLRNRLKQQELMAGIAQSFISGESMTVLIQEALKRVGEFMGADRVLVATTGRDGDRGDPACAWFSREQRKPPPEAPPDFKALVNGAFPQKISGREEIRIRSCAGIPDGEEFLILKQMDIKSFIWAPVYVKGSYWGLISVEQCDKTREWSESDIQLIGAVSSAVAGAAARDLIEKERSAALEQALQASAAKGNFLSNMSHEMRTPMNAIIGMTTIGKGAKDIEKKNYAFSKIEDASAHLLGVINDILDMSKIEANKLELSPVSFNFEKMLHKVVNVVNFRVEERRQFFYVTIDKQIPRFLVGDDQRLAQIITNLLSNAVKFTPEGGTIRLNVQRLKDEGESVLLRTEIKDTGIGISREQQERLFKSFEQAENNTTRKYGGTGLGLAISRQIVKMMDGKIWVESEPGRGSSFIFTVRMKKTQEGGSERLLNPGVNWSNVRILAVDDDVEIQKFFAGIAERFEIKCDIAGSAGEAMELIEARGNYDIYFIDWKMPGMNGLELSAKILERESKSVITMISAAALNEMEGDAKKAGIQRYLAKPLFPSDIADWINTCLGMPEADADQDQTLSPCRFDNNCILLVEDVEINREIVLALLEPTGLSIDCAENGREALRMFHENPGKYDMIFMDVQMPEMDGYEATRCIRNLDSAQAKNIPIVAMTANVFREDIEKALAAGMDDHVGKPLDINEVLIKLRIYLKEIDKNKSGLLKYGNAGFDSSGNWKYGLTWNPNLATGTEKIDSQHKQIFRLTGNLIAAYHGEQGITVMENTLDFLVSYLQRHLADEEALQIECRYPYYDEHKKLHDDFAEKILALAGDFKQNGSAGDLLEKIDAIVARWLIDHIKSEDLKFAEYLKGLPEISGGAQR